VPEKQNKTKTNKFDEFAENDNSILWSRIEEYVFSLCKKGKHGKRSKLYSEEQT